MLNNDAYVRCVEIGNGAGTSVFTPMSMQVREACQHLRDDPVFSAGPINIIGFS